MKAEEAKVNLLKYIIKTGDTFHSPRIFTPIHYVHIEFFQY